MRVQKTSGCPQVLRIGDVEPQINKEKWGKFKKNKEKWEQFKKKNDKEIILEKHEVLTLVHMSL